MKVKKYCSIIIKNNQKKSIKEEPNMIKAESIARVHTRNLLENKQAKNLALLSIYKTDCKYENT